MAYFSDRSFGPPPRVLTDMDETLRGAIVEVIRGRADDGSFGAEYPDRCPDNPSVIGTDTRALRAAIIARALHNPFQREADVPTTLQVLDLIEFGYEKIAQPRRRGGIHPYYDHYHLEFDRDAGRAAFREEMNQIFERNGIAFELRGTGRIERIAPEGLRDVLSEALFNTGDNELNTLLERARTKFLDRKPAIGKESLEALWDAWERLKSLENPNDKKERAKLILDKAAGEEHFRALLESEAATLTKIGNDFMIRHAEVNKTPINDDEHVDFLFHRLFAIIRLLLRKSNRGG